MPVRPRNRAVGLAAALVLGSLAVAAPATGARHGDARRLVPTSVTAPAPPDAAKDPQLRLTGIACPAGRECWAVGTYESKSGARRGVLEHLLDGTWHAQTAPEPTFADADPKVALDIVTCAAVDFCVAFGSYLDATDAPQRRALLEVYAAEDDATVPTWTGSPLLAPGGRLASIAAASCASAQSCAAVGSYRRGGIQHGLLETFGPGGWTAGDVAFTGDAYADAHAASSLEAVDCPADQLCSAAGYYTSIAGARLPLLERLDSAGWTKEPAAAPASAAGDPGIRLHALSCPGIDACWAGGRYTTTAGRGRGLIEVRSFGTWSPTVAPVPAGSAADPRMALTALSCAGAGDCVATGERTDKHGRQVGALLAIAGGQWTAVAAPLPRAAPDPKVDLADVSCGRVAVGSYVAADKSTRPLIEKLNAQGTWVARRGPTPANAGTGPASLAAVACDPGGHAFAVGRYVAGDGRHRGLITQNAQA